MQLGVLVACASIAGNTASWWLTQLGHRVTVVKQAPSLRAGDQDIDVRGVGREVLRRMGLDDAALASGTTEEGTACVNEDGSVAAQIVSEDPDRDGPTAELIILRGDLACSIYKTASKQATYRFGDTIKSIVNDGECVQVGFASGEEATFDLIIVAEGSGLKRAS